MQKANSAIDIAKLFFCICIIALHTKLFSALSATIDYYVTQSVLRLAVPFFFVASGYFLGKKLVKSDVGQYKSLVLKYCKRLLLPLLFFEAVNLIERGVYDYVHGKAILFIVSKSIKSIIFYPPGALWFLQACIIGALLLLPFLRLKKLNVALVLGGVFYMFALLCNNYYFLIEGTPLQTIIEIYMSHCHSARNGLFVGFLFLGLGIKCAYIEIRQCVCNHIFAICLVVGILEMIFLRDKIYLDGRDLLLSHVFIAPVLLVFLSRSNYSINSNISILFRNLSTGMYFIHKPILFLVSLNVNNVIFSFVLTTVIALSICILSYKTHFLKLDKLLK